MESIKHIEQQVKNCTLCEEHLPMGVRPIIQVGRNAKILIAGQAPGKRVHETGIPFNDASGDRLRDWLGLSKDIFYDPDKIAILPMGFCFPGTGKSGDLPPRKECAIKWRESILSRLDNVQLTLVIGQYAIKYHLPNHSKNLTSIVKSWHNHWPDLIPLPHPSPRNNIWLKRNPWFSNELLPQLKLRVANILSNKD